MNQRFIINDNGTVTDQSINLIWQRESAGPISWKDAIEYCKNLRLGEYNDWRLPTDKELSCLVDRMKFNPAIDTIAFPNTISSYYWSSTASTSLMDGAWCMSFYNGKSNYYRKYLSYYVRAVRGEQSGLFSDLTISEKLDEIVKSIMEISSKLRENKL